MSVFIPIPKKGDDKGCSNYCTIALISHTSKVMLKILQARLQQCMNRELPDVQAGFRKGRGTRDQISNIRWIIEKKVGLKLNIQEAKIMAFGPITSWEIDGETVETGADFIFGAPKSWQMVTAAMKLKDVYSLEE